MTPRRILAIKLRAMGDTLLMTAALTELRRAYPKAQIHALVTDSWAPLLEGHPGVDRVLSYSRRRNPASRAKTVAKLAIELRREKYDLAVCFHASPSSSALAFATGAPIRSVHFHGLKDKNRYSTVAIPGKGTVKPAIERDMDAVRALGILVPEGRLPSVVLTPTEEKRGSEILSGLGLADPILALGLGASRPTKRWPLERFAELAVGWAKQTGGGVIAVVSPDELELWRKLESELVALLGRQGGSQELRKKVRLLEPRPIRELAAVLSRVAVLAGNDSGPRHLAVAVGRPTLTLIGPEHPLEWHPYPRDRHPYFYVPDLPCRRDALPGFPPWCALENCTVEQHRCMRLIDVGPVLTESKRLMGSEA
ncbi:MAG TPA: glycosyltransferase family 9 protein [Bdellovibrionota bacterium]|jgi:ADP-heptose:LPS heptosyltransferase|nr:glycosyltransferase family 9 protein [Bdellovibrionota bacterium]